MLFSDKITYSIMEAEKPFSSQKNNFSKIIKKKKKVIFGKVPSTYPPPPHGTV